MWEWSVISWLIIESKQMVKYRELLVTGNIVYDAQGHPKQSAAGFVSGGRQTDCRLKWAL